MRNLYHCLRIPGLRNCEGSYYKNESNYVIGKLEDNGSATLEFYEEEKCLSTSWSSTATVNKATLESHACDAKTKWYSSKDDQASSSSGSTSGDSSVVVILICLPRAKGKHGSHLTITLLSGDIASLRAEMEGQKGLWNDDVITAKRIPRDKVKVKKLLSRGAFGEVYSGMFNGQQVAVKMLIPATRSSIQHVNDFLAEAKMTATMEHPHIVRCIGVAWDSLSDLCVVLEFMDGGDLRALLDKYHTSKHQVGLISRKRRSLFTFATRSRTFTPSHHR
ncbi:hypothetical protein Pcac1_g8570 [Phytophthora cactorum]|uniref:Protein kinase domain-containing protein n=1 Tax=Phytophthora cactorum TaxID=29920 RepID=A0A329SJE2_9STRA|nr:hypothetical protein Pcac1_g8570 [Phytophthora cactorum]RAW36196.1 hypothetical protein PC110_g7518 [Phytophthora cactorum]